MENHKFNLSRFNSKKILTAMKNYLNFLI